MRKEDLLLQLNFTDPAREPAPQTYNYKKEGELKMAKDRETVCLYYISMGECKKGREASHKGYCQKCNKYYPRSKGKHINMKKKKIEKIRLTERD